MSYSSPQTLKYRLFQELSTMYPNEEVSLIVTTKKVSLKIGDKIVTNDNNNNDNELYLMREYILLVYKKKIVSLYEKVYHEKVLKYELTYDYANKYFETVMACRLYINDYSVYDDIVHDDAFYIILVKDYYNKLLQKYQKMMVSSSKNTANNSSNSEIVNKNVNSSLEQFLREKQKTQDTFIYNGEIPEKMMKLFNLEKMVVVDQIFYLFKE